MIGVGIGVPFIQKEKEENNIPPGEYIAKFTIEAGSGGYFSMIKTFPEELFYYSWYVNDVFKSNSWFFDDMSILPSDIIYAIPGDISFEHPEWQTPGTAETLTYVYLETGSGIVDVDISKCINLQNFEISYDGGNALTESCVNKLLADLVANGITNGLVSISDMNLDTAVPTGQGLIDKATLESRGWIITTN